MSKLTTSMFAKRVHDLTNGTYALVGEYHGSKTKVTIKHLACGKTFAMLPTNFSRGQRCPYCKQQRLSKSHTKTTAKFKQEVADFDPDYVVVGEYHGSKVPVTMKHLVCGHQFQMTPDVFLYHNGQCPYCKK